MLRGRWRHKAGQRIALQVFLACLVAYFIYHTVQGDRGIVAMLQMQNQVRAAEAERARLLSERAALETRVKKLRPEGVDPDLLDEQARKTLNAAKPNEVIILLPPDQPPTQVQQNNDTEILQRSKTSP